MSKQTDLLNLTDAIASSADATAITIDSSENVMVGKAVTNLGTAGITLGESGFGSFTRSGYEPLNVNRLSSDGAIAKFYKDGAEIGSIGVVDGDNLFIGSSASDHAGFYFNNTNVKPYVNGAVSDNTMNIGASAERFKDLYLSGGVYLGGTGAANKLDDYEEGTFTPTVRGSSNTGTAGSLNAFGKYTKIGRQVNVQMKVDYQSHTGSGDIQFANLPFTSGTNNPSEATGTVMLSDVDTNSARPHLTFYMGGGVTHCQIFQSGDNIGWSVVGVTNEVSAFRLSLTYFTS